VEAPTATLHVSTQLVLLDVSVVDKKGRPASAKLDRDDFSIAEDGKPQQILSFEPSSLQPARATTVFVLDELNSRPDDKAYYLVCLEQYLRSLPETLPNPTELMVLKDSGLKIVQAPTRSRAELSSALAHLPPRDATLVNLQYELLARTATALELIAIESLGSAGRTAVVWLGPGYGVDLDSQPMTRRSQTEHYLRNLTNTLVESRTTLHVLFPPDFAVYDGTRLATSGSAAAATADPYRGGFNLRTLAAQTGGSVYSSTNDLVGAMRASLDLERGSYKLGYRPNLLADGRFRQIRVAVRDPNLRVVTKSGYYAPEAEAASEPQAMQVFQMAEAARSTLPFQGLPIRVTHVSRCPDTHSAEFTIFAEGKDLPWRTDDAGESLSELTAGGLSLSKEGKRLSSNFRNVNIMTRSQDPSVLAKTTASFKLVLTIPENTDHVRLVVSSLKDGRLGCIDIDRAAIDAATADVSQVSAP
jgi:VWFA-related protein